MNKNRKRTQKLYNNELYGFFKSLILLYVCVCVKTRVRILVVIIYNNVIPYVTYYILYDGMRCF